MTKEELLIEYWRLRDLYLQLSDPSVGSSLITSWGNPEFVDSVADIAIVRTEIKNRMDAVSREIQGL